MPLQKIAVTRHVIMGILACVKITSLRHDACTAIDVTFDMLKQRRSPNKKSKKGGAKGSVAVQRVYSIGLCVSRFSSEKVNSTEKTKTEIK